MEKDGRGSVTPPTHRNKHFSEKLKYRNSLPVDTLGQFLTIENNGLTKRQQVSPTITSEWF